MRREFSRKTRAQAFERSKGCCEVCVVPGCEAPQHAKSMCSSHYARWRRHGDASLGGTAMGAAKAFLDALPSEGEGCITWPFARDQNGYGKVFVDGRLHYASRLVCEKVNGTADENMEAAHACGKGHEGCIAPWHLTWKTRHENLRDKIKHGTSAIKLTEDDVRQIRALRPHLTFVEIGQRFGISASAAHGVAARKTWRHVE